MPTQPHNGLGWPIRFAVPGMCDLETQRPSSVSVALRGHVSCIEKPEPETDREDRMRDNMAPEGEKAPLVPSETLDIS